MLELYDGKLSRTVLRRESGSNPADLVDYKPLVKALGGEVIRFAPDSKNYINPLALSKEYGEGDIKW